MILHKKMIRDLMERKGPNAGIILLMSIGIMVFTSFYMLNANMIRSTASFYKAANLSDFFITLKAMPRDKIGEIINIPGIKKAQGRISVEAKVDFKGSKESTYLRMISMENSGDDLNRFILTEGSYPQSGKNQILVDQMFAKANKLSPGAKIRLTLRGREWIYTISGMGASPEYVYAMRNTADLFPDNRTFGVGLMPLGDLEGISGLAGMYNSASATVIEGSDINILQKNIQDTLKPWGVLGVLSRDQQLSWKMVDSELDRLQVFGRILPLIFWGIAALVEFIMLERLVASQRGQIGILRAFGYSSKEVLRHFMLYAIVLGILGTFLGSILGTALFFPLIDLFGAFFNFPSIEKQLYPHIFIYAGVLSLVFALLAGRKGAIYAARLHPVEAMSPEIPGYSGNQHLVKFLLPLFDTWGKMSLRNIQRNKKRSFFLILGITVTCALGIMSMVMSNAADELIYDQYKYWELYDAKMVFSQEVKASSAQNKLMGQKGVEEVETLLEVPATLHNKHLKKDVAIIGIPENSTMYHIVDEMKNPVRLKGSGVVLSQRAAELLDAQVGSSLVMDSPMKKGDEKVGVFVEGIVYQNVGLGAYMEKNALEKLLGQKDRATSAIFRIQSDADLQAIREHYKDGKFVSGITSIEESLRQIKELMGSYMSMVYIYSLLAVLIGFVVIYNSYLVTVNERSRELASLLVLGMSRKEVSKVVALEQWILSITGMILGWPLGKLMIYGIKTQVDTDLFTLPATLAPKTLLVGLSCTLIAVWTAQMRGKKKIKELSIVEVLKSRE